MRIRRRLPIVLAVLLVAAAVALAVILRKHAPPEPARLLPAADGFVALACPTEAFFRGLVQALGAPEVLDDPRFATAKVRADNRAAVIERLSELTGALTKAELHRRLGGVVPFGPVGPDQFMDFQFAPGVDVGSTTPVTACVPRGSGS